MGLNRFFPFDKFILSVVEGLRVKNDKFQVPLRMRGVPSEGDKEVEFRIL